MNVFIDSNILVYGYDKDAGEKHVLARGLIEKIWAKRDTRLRLYRLK